MSSEAQPEPEGRPRPSPGQRTASFAEFATAHERLREDFQRHQELLLAGRLEEAWVQLLRYRRRLIRHMKFEENQLLPIYRRDPVLPSGKPAFFLLDHRQVLELMDELYDRYHEAKRADPSDRPRHLIRLLDTESRFKSLVEHHETREERHLFPRLDEIASEHEKAALLAQVESHLE